MRYFIVFQVFIMFLGVVLAPDSASAGDVGRAIGNFTKYIWGPPQSDVVRPYLEDAKIPHNARWADDEWSPKDWVDARGGDAVAVVNGFYSAGIIADQYFDDDVPVLEVGQGFLDLGAQDKRRVVAFMDEVFGVTKFAETPVILIYFHKRDKPIGVFTAQGLQLQ